MMDREKKSMQQPCRYLFLILRILLSCQNLVPRLRRMQFNCRLSTKGDRAMCNECYGVNVLVANVASSHLPQAETRSVLQRSNRLTSFSLHTPTFFIFLNLSTPTDTDSNDITWGNLLNFTHSLWTSQKALYNFIFMCRGIPQRSVSRLWCLFPFSVWRATVGINIILGWQNNLSSRAAYRLLTRPASNGYFH